MTEKRKSSAKLMLCPRRRIQLPAPVIDRKSTRLNSSHSQISYAVFCLKKKTTKTFFRARPPTYMRVSYPTVHPSRKRQSALNSYSVLDGLRALLDAGVHANVSMGAASW